MGLRIKDPEEPISFTEFNRQITALENAGVTPLEVAKRMETHRHHIINWYRGERGKRHALYVTPPRRT